MADLRDIVQKAFYLGVGLAASAGERAGGSLSELRSQAQKVAEEMVSKGQMTTEEARKFVDDMVKQAQQPTADQTSSNKTETNAEPRRIEILDDEEPQPEKSPDVDSMRQQVQDLEEQLKKLKRDR